MRPSFMSRSALISFATSACCSWNVFGSIACSILPPVSIGASRSVESRLCARRATDFPRGSRDSSAASITPPSCRLPRAQVPAFDPVRRHGTGDARSCSCFAATCIGPAHLCTFFERLLSDLRHESFRACRTFIQFWPAEHRCRWIECERAGDHLQDESDPLTPVLCSQTMP